MAKRRMLLVGLTVAVVTVGAWSLGGSATGPRLRVENYPEVRVGLSQAEVEELLGGPPGNYGRYARVGESMVTCEGYLVPPSSVEQIWCDDSTRFEIYFDERGRVVGHHKRAGYQQTPPEGVFAGLWRLARRQLGV